MRYLCIVAISAMCAAAPSLSAQQRVSIDLRAAAAAPTQKLGATELGTGLGLGGTVAFRLQPHLHVYGGWDYMHFAADNVPALSAFDYEETGYTLGLRFEHPVLASPRFAFRVEGGATYKHIEIENDDGDLVADSDHGAGFEAGAGVVVPLAGAFKGVAMARYRSLSRDFTIGTVTTNGALRYIGLEVGVTRRF